MDLTSKTRVTDRVIAILLAGPRNAPYSGVVGGNTGTARYQSDDEISDAILEADSRVVLAIIETPGHPARTQYLTSSAVTNGGTVPAHVGTIANIKVDGVSARTARSRNQMLQVIANPELYTEAEKWCWLDDVTLLFNGTAATVTYPTFTLTSTCQSPVSYEPAVISLAVALLAKDGASSDYYSYYSALYAQQESLIRQGQMVIPEIEQQRAA